jgi:hypothetical protein
VSLALPAASRRAKRAPRPQHAKRLGDWCCGKPLGPDGGSVTEPAKPSSVPGLPAAGKPLPSARPVVRPIRRWVFVVGVPVMVGGAT